MVTEEGKYVVVENSGHEGEEIVAEFDTLSESLDYLGKAYRRSERKDLYLRVAVIKDGIPYYEF